MEREVLRSVSGDFEKYIIVNNMKYSSRVKEKFKKGRYSLKEALARIGETEHVQNEVSNMLLNNEEVTFGKWMLRNLNFSEYEWREVTGFKLNNGKQTI